MTAPRSVCAHVKRGICPTCANPLKPTRADRTNDCTTFGAKLTIALLTAGYRPNGRRNKPRRNRSTTRPAN